MEAATARTMAAVRPDRRVRARARAARADDRGGRDAARGQPDARVKHLVEWVQGAHPGRARPDLHRVRRHEALPRKQLRAALTPGREAIRDRHVPRRHGRRRARRREARVQRRPGEASAPRPDCHRRRARRRQPAEPLRGPVPLRRALESQPARTAQRPHRPQAPARAGSAVSLLRLHAAAGGPRAQGAGREDQVSASSSAAWRRCSSGELEERLSDGFSRRDAPTPGAGDRGRTARSREASAATREELEVKRARETELTERDRRPSGRCWQSRGTGCGSTRTSCGRRSRAAWSCSAPNLSHRAATTGVFRAARPVATGFKAIASWMHTLDTLRAPQGKGSRIWEWRQEQPIRPVVFDDQGSLDAHAVHLHLEHRFVQRLLGRFRSQGFVHNDLSRACIGVYRRSGGARRSARPAVALRRARLAAARPGAGRRGAMDRRWTSARARSSLTRTPRSTRRWSLLEKALSREAAKTIARRFATAGVTVRP